MSEAKYVKLYTKKAVNHPIAKLSELTSEEVRNDPHVKAALECTELPIEKGGKQ